LWDPKDLSGIPALKESQARLEPMELLDRPVPKDLKGSRATQVQTEPPDLKAPLVSPDLKEFQVR
jgi:hypothetical protein